MDQGNSQHNTNNNQPQVNNNQDAGTTTTSLGPTNRIGQVVIPYVQGTTESFKHICGKYGIKVHFKGNTTIKQILMKPKDQDPMDKKSGVVYSYQCNNISCDEEYLGETARTLGERCKEHLKQPSPPTHTSNKHDTILQTLASTSWKGGPWAGQNNQGIYLHKGK